MATSVPQLEPILPYPSRESVSNLIVAMIEQRFGLSAPERWPKDESYYLAKDDATQFSEFRNAVSEAINAIDPPQWLLRELKEFEQTIAEDAVEALQNTPEGQTVLDAMQAIAVYRHRQERQSHEG